ncbi:MAG: ATP-dependent DNA helicase [Thermoplasmatota archaeon]
MLFCPSCRALMSRRASGASIAARCPNCGYEAGATRARAVGETSGARRSADFRQPDRSGADPAPSPPPPHARPPPPRALSPPSAARGSRAAGTTPRLSASQPGALTNGGLPKELARLFPYDEVRPGQGQFLIDAFSVFEGRGHLLANAPTGIGKTVSSLVAAIAAARGAKKRVLFLTSKQTQHRLAVDTLAAIRDVSGEELVVVDLISKRDMCPRSEARSLPAKGFAEFCAREQATKACAHFRNSLKSEDGAQFLSSRILHVEDAVRLLGQRTLCPHQTAMDAAKGADVVICDYNHLFSDLREGFAERVDLNLGEVILVVDEAHNLPDRIRDHLALDLSERILDEAEDELHRAGDEGEVRLLSAIRAAFQELVDALMGGTFPPGAAARRDGESSPVPASVTAPANRTSRFGAEETLVPRDVFTGALDRQARRLRGLLEIATYEDMAAAFRKAGSRFEKSERVAPQAIARVSHFLDNWRIERRGLLRLLHRDRLGEWVLTYELLDPAVVARPVFDSVYASVLMSGTLHPADATRDTLGLEPARTIVEDYPSPFDPSNRMVLVDTSVSTLYDERGPAMFDRIATHLRHAAEATPGHMAAFFPSYALLEQIHPRIEASRPVIIEEKGLGKEQRERMVADLRDARDVEGKLLLGVLGGGLSEGYDFERNLLRTVAIVGLPLAPPSLEQDALIRYATERFGAKGRLYSYVVPSMNRVIQAAGRLIRSPTDRGVVLLMDKRFAGNPYRGCLPRDWNPRDTTDPRGSIREFFAHQATRTRA